MTTSTCIAKTKMVDDAWVPNLIAPEAIYAGTPNARAQFLRSSVDGEAAYFTGFWAVEPSQFQWVFANNETALLLEGRVTVTQKDGPTLELGPGDLVSFPKGAITRWHVHEAVKKAFVVSG